MVSGGVRWRCRLCEQAEGKAPNRRVAQLELDAHVADAHPTPPFLLSSRAER